MHALGTIQNEELKLEIVLLKSRRDRGKDTKVREISAVAITKLQSLVKRGEHNVDSKTKPARLRFLASTDQKTPNYRRRCIKLDK